VVRNPLLFTRFTVGEGFVPFLPVCAGLSLFYRGLRSLLSALFISFEQKVLIIPAGFSSKPTVIR